MSVLFRPCKIFVDFRDIICNTDSFVIKYIVRGVVSNTLKLNFFKSMADEFSNLNDNKLAEILSVKANYNPLMDFVQYDELVDCNVFSEMNNLYNSILYSNDIIDDLVFTKVAESIKTLLRSKDCQQLDIFMEKMSPVIYKQLHDFFGNCTKIKLIVGDKESLYKSVPYDCYFMSDITDIDYILNMQRVNLCDVITINNRCNTTIVDEDENTKLILPEPPDKMVRDYKLNITTIESLY